MNEKKTIVEEAKARLKVCQDAEHDQREESLSDFRFYSGEQWPADIKTARSKQGSLAVCMTVNRCKPAVKQLTNDQRQNRGAIKVSPVDSGADVETAEILQGMIRHIEYDSNADVAYDTASEHQTIGGFGWFGVITEYLDPKSFDQCAKIRRFRNCMTVFIDPASTEPDGSDAKYAFVVEKLSKEDYQAEYPDSEMASLCLAEDATVKFPEWVDDDGVVVAEYFYTENERKTLYLLPDKTTTFDLPEGVEAIDEREVDIESVKWCKINGKEVLDETDWPGRYIPIVKVIGDELEIDGEVVLEGIIRQAKDPQRMINYWRSKQTEAIALAPKAPFVGAVGQFENRPEWDTANILNHSKLEYNATDVGGHPLPPPARNVAEPAIQAITIAGAQANEDFDAVTQLHESSYGERSNEKSGKAVLARREAGQAGNFHFVDNLTRSRRHLGRILIDLIPKIYTGPRMMRIIGEDGTQDSVQINTPTKWKGLERVFDVTTGRYDVIVETGPSFATRRKEAVESMLAVISAQPAMMAMVGDLLVKNMDWPGADEVAKRLERAVPPELKDKDGQPPIPPEVQQQMAQMSKLVEAQTQQIEDMSETIKYKQLELASKERIELAKIDAERDEGIQRLGIEAAKLDSQEAIAALKADVELLKVNINKNMADEAREAEQFANSVAEPQ